MAKFPALPLWTDAYLADTAHLTDAEHGRYLLMLFLMWRMPMMRFPHDDAWLARKLGRSVEVIESEWKPLMREFFRCDGNWWTHKRLACEWEYLSQKRKQQSDAAKARWDKEKKSNNADANRNASRNAPTPLPLPLSSIEEAKASSHLKPPRGDFEAFWILCPRKVGKGAARKAYAKALQQATQDDLLAGMRKYAASRRGEEEAFTVHPATWLNQERWLDGKAQTLIVRDAVWQAEQDELKRKGLI